MEDFEQEDVLLTSLTNTILIDLSEEEEDILPYRKYIRRHVQNKDEKEESHVIPLTWTYSSFIDNYVHHASTSVVLTSQITLNLLTSPNLIQMKDFEQEFSNNCMQFV